MLARTRSSWVRRSVRTVSDLDRFSAGLVTAGLVAAGLAVALRPADLAHAADSTAGPFLEVGAVVAAGWAAVRMGLFDPMTRLPRWLPASVKVALVLVLTAAIGGLVNLDLAVVVIMPVAFAVAADANRAAGTLAVSVAVVANATSFLLPTSNLTNLLVTGHHGPPFARYAGDTWVAWAGVTVLTVAALVPLSARPTAPGPARAMDADWSLRRIATDLAAMFLLASALRALWTAGVTLPGGFAEQAMAGAGMASAADNLPVAAVVHGGTGAGPWAAILAMSAGANLFVTGSVATVLCRRLAIEAGATFPLRRFALTGAVLLPVQLAVAYAGPRLTGAIR